MTWNRATIPPLRAAEGAAASVGMTARKLDDCVRVRAERIDPMRASTVRTAKAA